MTLVALSLLTTSALAQRSRWIIEPRAAIEWSGTYYGFESSTSVGTNRVDMSLKPALYYGVSLGFTLPASTTAVMVEYRRSEPDLDMHYFHYIGDITCTTCSSAALTRHQTLEATIDRARLGLTRSLGVRGATLELSGSLLVNRLSVEVGGLGQPPEPHSYTDWGSAVSLSFGALRGLRANLEVGILRTSRGLWQDYRPQPTSHPGPSGHWTGFANIGAGWQLRF